VNHGSLSTRNKGESDKEDYLITCMDQLFDVGRDIVSWIRVSELLWNIRDDIRDGGLQVWSCTSNRGCIGACVCRNLGFPSTYAAHGI